MVALPQPMPLQVQLSVVAPPQGGASRALLVVGIVTGIVVAASTAIGVFFAVPTHIVIPALPAFPEVIKLAEVQTDTSVSAWQGHEDKMPIVVFERLGLKGEAFLTGLRASSPNDSLYFALVDAKSRTELWRTPSLGTYSDAYQGSHAVVLGSRVIYTDARNTLHILTLATGALERSGTFSDRARHLCIHSPNQVMVDTSDEKPVIFDVTTGVRQPATSKDLPAACRGSSYSGRMQSLPQVPGFSIRGALSDATNSVAWGYKSPGTRTVSVFGIDPKSRSVRWQSVLASNAVRSSEGSGGEHAQLAAGYLVLDYKVKNTDDENRIAAFEAQTGKRLWDTGLKGIFAVDNIEGIGASENWVYVHRMGIVDVLNAKTGVVEGTFLNTTYDSAFGH
jgi:PQQ-like domain